MKATARVILVVFLLLAALSVPGSAETRIGTIGTPDGAGGFASSVQWVWSWLV